MEMQSGTCCSPAPLTGKVQKATGWGCPRGRLDGATKGFCYGRGQGWHPRNLLPPAPPPRRRTNGKPKWPCCGEERILSFKALGWKIRDEISPVASGRNHSADDKLHLLARACAERALSERGSTEACRKERDLHRGKTGPKFGLLGHGYYQLFLGKLIPSQDDRLGKLT